MAYGILWHIRKGQVLDISGDKNIRYFCLTADANSNCILVKAADVN